MAGEIAEVVPLDEKETHAGAEPVKGGKVELSEAGIEAREKAMVARLVTSQEPVMLLC